MKNFVNGEEVVFLSMGEGGFNLFYTLPFLWCFSNGNGVMKIVLQSLSRP